MSHKVKDKSIKKPHTISNLTKQSFPEICRNNQALNETMWTLKCDKLHVFDMVDELKRKCLLLEYYLCVQ